MSPPPPPPSPRFRVAVRRLGAADGLYAVRFEVRDGKGVLRLSRADVMIDPPPRAVAEETGLTPSQLRSSRFLHLWDGGRARQAHSLARLDSASLLALPPLEWVDLEVVPEAGVSYLLVPQRPVAGVAAPIEVVGDEPTSPRHMLHVFRSQVETTISPLPVARRPVQLPPEPYPAPDVADPDAERTVLLAPVRGSGSPTLAEEPTEVPSHLFDSPEASANLAAAPRPPAPGVAGLDPSWPGVYLHARSTTVVRYLRRRLTDDRLRIQELEAALLAARGRRGDGSG